jgi:hypothetical protein
VLDDHLHLIVEAKDRQALSRGMKGLLVRVAKALNRLWSRRGRVFADRYHDRILESPREVRNALAYVLNNARKHAAEGRMVRVAQAIDVFTSAPWFDGWKEPITVRGLEAVVRPVAPSRTWLLSVGWRRHGLLNAAEAAAGRAGRRLASVSAQCSVRITRPPVTSVPVAPFGSLKWCRREIVNVGGGPGGIWLWMPFDAATFKPGWLASAATACT